MHVDGFRFDLASVFSRNTDGSLNWGHAPIFSEIAADPVLGQLRLIAEPWDTGAYQLGRGFPGITWLQWNGRFRDDVRRFVKGDPGMVPDLMRRIYGSDDFFPDSRADAYHAYQSVNYVTSHDGFTLYDLVAYNQKRNWANGNNNQDGMDDNYSWNCGHEGDEGAPAEVLALRRKQVKNFFCLLMLSNGTPMFRAGDEFLNTQFGNNNPYNQDNTTGWLDWSQLQTNQDIFRFFKNMISFRKSHPALGRSRFWREDVAWYGTGPRADLSYDSRSLAFCLHGASQNDDDIYVMINAYWEELEFHIQEGTSQEWTRIVDTALPSPDDFSEGGDPLRAASYKVAAAIGGGIAPSAEPMVWKEGTRRIMSVRSKNSFVRGLLLIFMSVIGQVSAVAAATSSAPSPTNIFAPASTPAKSIVHLSVFVLVITGIIFAVVFTLLVYALIKFRGRALDAGREPAQVYGSTQIELAWTIIPILIVVVLFLATARVIHAIQDAPQPPGAIEVTAIGHQYWWEFRYPKLGIVTANELHIPVSDPATSDSYVFELAFCRHRPQLLDPGPGGEDGSDSQPSEPDVDGSARDRNLSRPVRPVLRCTTRQDAAACLCGSPEDFAAWVRGQQQPAVQDVRVETGRRVFESTACINCHAVAGTNAKGRFGPDLTHLMSRTTIAAGAAPNTPEMLRLWIQDPNKIKPGSQMPAMQLSDQELDAVVSYMETLR